MLLLFLLKCIYLILPGIVANTTPVLAKNYLKSLAVPLDFNKQFKGKPILGSHKTFRGIFVGLSSSVIVSYLQYLFYDYDLSNNLSFINYNEINVLLFGFLMGVGVLSGDAIKSFFKRRGDIKPGAKFIPFDQLDSIIGLVLIIYPFYYKYIPFTAVMLLIPLWFFGHVVITRIGYYTGFREDKW